jgi:hypothetical protein
MLEQQRAAPTGCALLSSRAAGARDAPGATAHPEEGRPMMVPDAQQRLSRLGEQLAVLRGYL